MLSALAHHSWPALRMPTRTSASLPGARPSGLPSGTTSRSQTPLLCVAPPAPPCSTAQMCSASPASGVVRQQHGWQCAYGCRFALADRMAAALTLNHTRARHLPHHSPTGLGASTALLLALRASWRLPTPQRTSLPRSSRQGASQSLRLQRSWARMRSLTSSGASGVLAGCCEQLCVAGMPDTAGDVR
jgi:hypothetical protein